MISFGVRFIFSQLFLVYFQVLPEMQINPPLPTTGLDLELIGINYLFTCSTACREDPLGLPSAAWALAGDNPQLDVNIGLDPFGRRKTQRVFPTSYRKGQ
jgi:hypothetical protein